MNQPMGSNFQWFGRELSREVADAAKDALIKGGFKLESDIKKSMKPGSGNTYRRGFLTPKGGGRRKWNQRKGQSKLHQASAPGEPPAVDSGRLRASISTNWSGSGMAEGKTGAKAEPGDGIHAPTSPHTVRVGTNVEYAMYLERGTPHVEARPYIRPAFAKMRGNIDKFFRNILKPGRRR